VGAACLEDTRALVSSRSEGVARIRLTRVLAFVPVERRFSALRVRGLIAKERRKGHRVAIAAFVARFIAAAARGFAGAAVCGELIGRDALLFDHKLFGKQCNNGETSARLQHATMSNEAGRAQR
jgi:hypothetical protein